MAETTTPQRRVVVRRYKRKGHYFTEALSAEVGLDMVQIPSGTFLMGSSAEELDSRNSERPQHEVTVSTFSWGDIP